MERYGEGEAYWYEIEEIRRLYSIDLNSFDKAVQAMIDIYRDALLMVIEEIHQNLQIMDIKELLTSETLAPFENSGHSYDKEKLMVYLHDRDSDYTSRVLGRMGLQNMVEKGELPEIALEFDGDELLIFLNAWQWSINEKD